MKNKKYHTVGTVPKSYKKKEETKFIPLTQMLDRSLSWLDAGTSMKCNIPEDRCDTMSAWRIPQSFLSNPEKKYSIQ